VTLSVENLRKQLKAGELQPIYVLYGEETNLRDLAARTIADRAFGPDDFRDFNISEFNLSGEDSLREAIAAAEQLPMMASRRVIFVRNVRVSLSGRGDTVKEEHESLLAGYFARPAETTVLIFIADELNGVRKVGKFLRACDGAVEFTTLNDRDLAERASRQFAEAEVRIDRNALTHLIAIVGSDTSRLSNEVNKLIAASYPDRVVTTELIDSLVAQSRELGPWAVTNTLSGTNKATVIETLRKSLDEGAEPVMLIGALAGHYRRMLMAADMMSRGLERREIEKAIRLPYGQQESFLRASRQAGTKKLAEAVKRIAEADLAIKTSVGGSGPAGTRASIEKLVCELVSL
jgi:DNA polymerase III subunit delta